MPLRWVDPDDSSEFEAGGPTSPRRRSRSVELSRTRVGAEPFWGQTVNIADASLQRERRRVKPIMNVALTGATGFIGSHVLVELQKHGHDVTALVRDDAGAAAAQAGGATAAVVDLYDRPAVVGLLSEAGGGLPTPHPGGATSAGPDAA